MKKRLLTQLLALACVMGAYAYNIGDYIFSPTAKFKVLSTNFVTNGDFSQSNRQNVVGTASNDATQMKSLQQIASTIFNK